MFYLCLWAGTISLGILMGIKGLYWMHVKKTSHYGNHYFIIVKNYQGKIEWVIRSVHLWGWIEGKQKKITVFDLGSEDDTLNILNRMAYPKRKINHLYTYHTEQFAHQLGDRIEKSIKAGEKPIILYLNRSDKRTSQYDEKSPTLPSSKMT